MDVIVTENREVSKVKTRIDQAPRSRGHRTRWGSAVGGALLLLTAVGCAPQGPSTQEEVCADYRELGEELLPGRLLDNTVFWKAKALGRSAARYEASEAVVADGEALIEIGESDQTSTEALDQASAAVASLCGQPRLALYTAKLLLEGAGQ